MSSGLPDLPQIGNAISSLLDGLDGNSIKNNLVAAGVIVVVSKSVKYVPTFARLLAGRWGVVELDKAKAIAFGTRVVHMVYAAAEKDRASLRDTALRFNLGLPVPAMEATALQMAQRAQPAMWATTDQVIRQRRDYATR
jgi:hypothetical protein